MALGCVNKLYYKFIDQMYCKQTERAQLVGLLVEEPAHINLTMLFF
jgi:hypothetical protein